MREEKTSASELPSKKFRGNSEDVENLSNYAVEY